MDPKFLDQFDDSYKAAMKEQELIRNLESALDARIKTTIGEFFPDEIQHLSAEGYRDLNRIVYRHASAVTIKIVEVFSRHVDDQ